MGAAAVTGLPPLTPAAVDAIEAREQAASKGPWEADLFPQPVGEPGAAVVSADRRLSIASERSGRPLRREDADFIAAARADVPRLVAEVRRLRAEKAPRIVAALGGGDWTDASVSHLRIPADLDLKAREAEWRAMRDKHAAEYREFNQWMGDKEAAGRLKVGEYNQAASEWCAAHPRPPGVADWLVANHGAERIDIEEIEDDF